MLVRADSAGATHGLVDYCCEAGMRFSVGYELTSRFVARSSRSEDAWVGRSKTMDRTNGDVCEVTDMVDLSPGRRAPG